MGKLTPRTVSGMQNPEPTGVVFVVNINTGPGEANLLFNQFSVAAVSSVDANFNYFQSVFRHNGTLCPVSTRFFVYKLYSLMDNTLVQVIKNNNY